MTASVFTPTLTKTELCRRLTLSARTVEIMVREGRFPPPVRIGKLVYWSEKAIVEWQRSLFMAQENWCVQST